MQRPVQKFLHFQILWLANDRLSRALPVLFKELLNEREHYWHQVPGGAKFRTHVELILYKRDHI